MRSPGDSSTLKLQVETLRERFGLAAFSLVGDWDIITGNHLPALRAAGVEWVSALKSQSLKKLVVDGVIQPSPFDEQNLAETVHAGYPGVNQSHPSAHSA